MRRAILVTAFLFTGATYLNSQTIANYEVNSNNTGRIKEIQDEIHLAYEEVLKRAPDETGLETYTRIMMTKGKDGNWLRDTLSRSQEGRAKRKKSLRRSGLIYGMLSVAIVGCILLWTLRVKMRRMLGGLWNKFPYAQKHYLMQPTVVQPIAVVIGSLFVYSSFGSGGIGGYILCGVLATSLMIAFRVPRWLIYIGALLVMLCLLSWCVLVDANGPDDRFSDRDDAVEIAALALMSGGNPWSESSPLGLPITTGPTNVLLAMPFVKLFGKVNMLSLSMWIFFFAIVLFADIYRRNNVFLMVSLLFATPWLGFLHTLHWSLDELYYAAILSPLIWLMFVRKKYFIAGMACGAMILSRVSYLFTVIAIVLWWVLAVYPSLKSLFVVAFGSGVFIVAILGLFLAVGGNDFIQHNFWVNAQAVTKHSGGRFLAGDFDSILNLLMGEMMLRAILVVLAIMALAYPLRRLFNPFYLMTIASLLAHTILFSPNNPSDYQLIIVIPAIYGYVFSNKEALVL